jgi:hypothetical protein
MVILHVAPLSDSVLSTQSVNSTLSLPSSSVLNMLSLNVLSLTRRRGLLFYSSCADRAVDCGSMWFTIPSRPDRRHPHQ